LGQALLRPPSLNGVKILASPTLSAARSHWTIYDCHSSRRGADVVEGAVVEPPEAPGGYGIRGW